MQTKHSGLSWVFAGVIQDSSNHRFDFSKNFESFTKMQIILFCATERRRRMIIRRREQYLLFWHYLFIYLFPVLKIH